MISVTSAAGPYCIEATEVTIGAYSAFLMSNPPLSLMDPSCAGKTSYAPSNNLDLARPTYPVTYVDWCDAFAYCASLDRHLCGRIGRGAALGAVEVTDATKSEWYNACSKSGTRAYPYGTNYAQVCIDSQTGTVGPVGAAPYCVGGFPGIRDMSGNVQEWEDNCVPMGGSGLLDRCKTRGGGYNDGANGVACNAMTSMRRRNQSDDATGFRCCR
jgi:formylglycine-generating enzyme required for sulfatase activity